MLLPLALTLTLTLTLLAAPDDDATLAASRARLAEAPRATDPATAKWDCGPGAEVHTAPLERTAYGEEISPYTSRVRRGCVGADGRFFGTVLHIDEGGRPWTFERGEVLDDVPHGVWWAFDPEGRPQRSFTLDRGVKHGPEYTWTPGYRPLGAGHWRADQRVGTWRIYDLQGEVINTHQRGGTPPEPLRPTPTPSTLTDSGPAPEVQTAPWSKQTLWDLGQTLVLLVGLLLGWSLFTRRSPLELLPDVRASRMLGRRAVQLVVASALVTTGAWLMTASDIGLEQAAAMAFGGPSIEEVQSCRTTALLTSKCPYGGTLHHDAGQTWCSKHGRAEAVVP